MKYFVYILRTSSDTLYIGQTNDLEKRIEQHRNKKGAKYIKYFTSFELVYTEIHKSRTDAMKREIQLKKWPKVKKEALVKEKNLNSILVCPETFNFNVRQINRLVIIIKETTIKARKIPTEVLIHVS